MIGYNRTILHVYEHLLMNLDFGITPTIQMFYNYIEVASKNLNIIEELKQYKWTKNCKFEVKAKSDIGIVFTIGVNYEQIASVKNLDNYIIEKKVKQDFDIIYQKYFLKNESITNIYFITHDSFAVESDDLIIIEQIYNELKNYGYAQIENMHIFKYLIN